VPECESREERVKTDKAFCLKLFSEVLELEVQDADLKSVFRLGKKENQDRPLLIQFREKTLKNSVMECLYKLKDAEDSFKKISVSHDLTKLERAECKTLVEEAKKKQAEELGELLWRVRGLPGQLKIVKFRKSQ